MSEKLPKVLIVDDSPQWQMLYARRNIRCRVMILSALTITEAKQLFVDNPDLAGIIMDACVPGDSPNTMSLVSEFRQTFCGPIIATSTSEYGLEKLLEAGSNHAAEKQFALQKMFNLLGLVGQIG